MSGDIPPNASGNLGRACSRRKSSAVSKPRFSQRSMRFATSHRLQLQAAAIQWKWRVKDCMNSEQKEAISRTLSPLSRPSTLGPSLHHLPPPSPLAAPWT